MAGLRIVGLCILAAGLYGIGHDQVTARVCVEYFTIGHPRILSSESPTLLGLVWGVLGTWWVGLLLGGPLAFACRRGDGPRRTARSLVRPIAILLASVAAISLVAGIVGYALASRGVFVLLEPFASRMPRARHVAVIADGWAHSASYLAGLVGGVVLVRRVWKDRRAATLAGPQPARP